MASIAGRPEQVVQPAHLLGRLDVDRILRLDFLRAIAGDEAEMPDIFVRVGEPELAAWIRQHSKKPKKK